ncbi:MAG: ion channel [Candidatus Contendobacter sp.]|nr:ion channel [Candidatus Contendobacter sp.]
MIQVIQYLLLRVWRNPPVPMRILILLGAILLYGTTGFVYFELSENPEVRWADGLWYTMVTMTTVGYGDFFPKTPGGRFLVGWPVMAFGIGLLGYALSVIAVTLVTVKSREIRGMSSFELKDHLVIFNFPGLAKVESILEELFLDPAFGNFTPVVLVDELLEELPAELQKRGLHYVRGNPVRDQTLTRADIDHARHAVILCRNPRDPASDTLNIAIVLAIEGRNRNTTTVVECVDPASEELFRKAGCDKIVCTSRFDAYFLSQELLNPGVQEVIGDLLSARGGQQIYFVKVSREASFGELAQVCREKQHLALGVSASGKIRLNVPEATVVRAGDSLITTGPSRIPML